MIEQNEYLSPYWVLPDLTSGVLHPGYLLWGTVLDSDDDSYWLSSTGLTYGLDEEGDVRRSTFKSDRGRPLGTVGPELGSEEEKEVEVTS